MRWSVLVAVASGAFLFATPRPAGAQDATVAGEVTTPHPTLEHISIEWAFSGDDDADGQVTVRFREVGGAAWREGHPLVRVEGGSNAGFTWNTRYAGSLFGLAPGRDYEIELTLTDPDGGSATRSITASTRPRPTVAPTAREVPVDPPSLAGALASAAPGDVLVLAPGTYASFTVPNDGRPDAPIVVRSEEPGSAIVEGEVRADGRSDVWLLDLNVRGRIKFNNATRIVVQGCRIETDGDGIVSLAEGTRDGYFADNTILGPTVWRESALGASGDNEGEGIMVTGPGNVIEHNRVEGFRDCISLLEGGEAREQVSVDILGNDLSRCADDAIEADFAMGNVRVMRNRASNAFIAFSSQPSLGGPTWFVRNVAFGVAFQVFKPNRSSQGDILYHNTVVKQGDAFGVYTSDAWGHARSRNNLFIGGPDVGTLNGFDTGEGRILHVASLDTATSSFDYDGFGSELGRFDGRFGDTRFANMDELRALTTEQHAVEVDVSVFAASVAFPRSLFPPLAVPDLRLRDGSAAIDRGTPLANINDDFAGAAPDLGAHELGSSAPPFGPRTAGAVCGNGALEEGEECDDGGTRGGDGCAADCRLEGGPADAGSGSEADSGATRDGGTERDGGAASDAGGDPTGATEGGGCGCSAGGPADLAFPALLLLLGLRRRS